MLEKALMMLEKAHLWHCYLISHLGLEVAEAWPYWLMGGGGTWQPLCMVLNRWFLPLGHHSFRVPRRETGD